jgi:glyceraldehyde-3-phosphate dehydrogenase type II
MAEKVVVYGTGMVGSEILGMAASLQIPVIGVKRTANINDIKTRKNLQIIRKYRDANIEFYVTDGDDYEERVRSFRDLGFNAIGPTSKLNYDEVAYIVDASPKYVDKDNYENIYKHVYREKGVNFMIQGGGLEDNVDSCYASIPNAIGQTKFEELSKKNVKQVSCNTTFGATGMGLVLENEKPENINYVLGYFVRRERDPETKPGKSLKQKKGPETRFGTHHGADVGKVLPQLDDKIKPTVALKCPWEHFHETILIVDFDKNYDFDAIQDSFHEYPRAVTREGDFEMGDVIDRINEINIPDADCLFPLYHLRRPKNTKSLEIVGLTPQRSIVVPSALDMIAKKTKMKDAGWEEIVDYVNKNARWHGYHFDSLKGKLKWKLSPKT